VALVGCAALGLKKEEKAGTVEIRVPVAEKKPETAPEPKPAEPPKPEVKAEFKEVKPGMFAVDLASLANSDGITEEADRKDADYDEYKQSFSAEELPDAGLFEPKDVPAAFLFPAKDAGKKNNVACSGQMIPLSGKGKSLNLLVTATDGNQEAKVAIDYADGSVEADLKVTDWCVDPAFGEKDAVFCPHRVAAPADGSGNMFKEEKKTHIWAVAIPLDANRELKCVKLPQNAKIHVFALTLAR
jgi:hypothetical protein